MESLVGEWDGYSSNRNNFYLYHDPKSDKFHFIPWGADMILTSGSPIAARNPDANTAMFAYSTVTQRLANFSAMRARYRDQMNALLGSVWNESAILAEINRMDALLRPFAGDLSQAIQSVRDFVNARRAQIIAGLNNLPTSSPPLSIISPCLVQNGVISGAFTASWGTTGVVPPLQTGFSRATGAVSHVPLQVESGYADSGLSVTDPNPYVGLLNLYFVRKNGALAAVTARLDSTKLVTGATLPIDGKQVDATFLFLDGVATGGFFNNGTMTIYSSLTAPGGRVCGTFRAKAYFFSNKELADVRSESKARSVTQVETRHYEHEHLASVIQGCLTNPGAR
jgi:hypothetical protein